MLIKLGRKIAIITGIVVYSVFTGLCGITNSYVQFAVARFISGIGIVGVLPNLVSGLSEYSPLRNRAFMTTLGSYGTPLGNIVAVTCGVFVLQNYGWRPMFYLSILSLLLIPIICYLLPDSIVHYLKKGDKVMVGKILHKANPEFVPKEDDEYIVQTYSGKKASFTSLFEQRRATNTLLLWLMMLINMFILFGLLTWIPKLMIEQGYALGASLIMVGVFASGAIVGMPLIGWLVDQFGYKGLYLLPMFLRLYALPFLVLNPASL